MHDRRQHPRITVNRPAFVRIAGGTTQRVQIVDLSVAGLCLLMPSAVANGEILDVEFNLSVSGKNMTIPVSGIVCRSHFRAGQVAVGLQIQKIDSEAQQMLTKFIDFKLGLTGASRPGPRSESNQPV